MTSRTRFHTVIVGGGPAGTAVLLAACRSGRLGQMLDQGLAVVETSARLGTGQIGGHAVSSDSAAQTFIDCLTGRSYPELTALLEHPLVREIAAIEGEPLPLSQVGALMRLIGQALQRIVSRHPGCAIFTGHTATQARRDGRHGWRTAIADEAGNRLTLASANVVIATGARQPRQRLLHERVGNIPLMERYGDKVVQSAEVLQAGGAAAIAASPAGAPAPKVAVIGGSTSAVSVVHALLTAPGAPRFGEAGITLLHRRPLRIFYPTAAAAHAEGYEEFGPEDLCPLSGRVFRLAGLRFSSRELVMRCRGIGGRAAEPRVKLHQLAAQDPAARDILDEAGVIVAAFGYRPNALPIFGGQGTPIQLHAETGPDKPMVDGACRVMDAAGRPIAGLFGIGLGAGFVPRGALGGEPSFTGQAKGYGCGKRLSAS